MKVATAALDAAAKLLVGIEVAPFDRIQLGTGDTAESETSADLETPITEYGLAEAEVTPGYVSTGRVRLPHTFSVSGATGTVPLREYCIKNADGVAAARHRLAVVKNLENGESIQVVPDFVVTRGA